MLYQGLERLGNLSSLCHKIDEDIWQCLAKANSDPVHLILSLYKLAENPFSPHFKLVDVYVVNVLFD